MRQSLYDTFRRRVGVFVRQSTRAYEEADALHRTRVASRRLRELLPLLGAPAGSIQHLRRRLKKTTRRLGAVRDVDILISLVAELSSVRRYPRTVCKVLGADLLQMRQRALERLETKLPRKKMKRLARDLHDVARHLEVDNKHAKHPSRPPQTESWVLQARMVRRAGRLRDALLTAGTVYDAARLHVVRIALKKLRYALECRVAVDRWWLTADLMRLKRSQDLLGRLHDLELLLEVTRDVSNRTAPLTSRMRRDFALFASALELDCRRQHAQFLRTVHTVTAVVDRQLAAIESRPARSGRMSMWH